LLDGPASGANGKLYSFTVITGDGSGASADIHDRMPVWLTAGQADLAQGHR